MHEFLPNGFCLHCGKHRDYVDLHPAPCLYDATEASAFAPEVLSQPPPGTIGHAEDSDDA